MFPLPEGLPLTYGNVGPIEHDASGSYRWTYGPTANITVQLATPGLLNVSWRGYAAAEGQAVIIRLDGEVVGRYRSGNLRDVEGTALLTAAVPGRHVLTVTADPYGPAVTGSDRDSRPLAMQLRTVQAYHTPVSPVTPIDRVGTGAVLVALLLVLAWLFNLPGRDAKAP